MTTEPRSCFGLQVDDDCDLALTRPGAGRRLHVCEVDGVDPPGSEPLVTWRIGPDGETEARVHPWDDGLGVYISDHGWFRVHHTPPRIEMPRTAHTFDRERRLWGIPASLALIRLGDLAMHAAAVEVGSRAILFVGPSHAGKTTLAAAFHQRGHRLLSEDTTAVSLAGQLAVWPGPPVVRLRHDMGRQLEMPRAALVQRDSEKVHYLIDEVARGDARPVPLAAVVTLGWGRSYELSTADGADVLPDLWTVVARLPTDEDRTQAFTAVARLVSTVPIMRLRRPRGIDGLNALVDRLAEELPPGPEPAPSR